MNTERLGGVATFLSGFAFKSNLFNDEEKGMPIIRIRDVVRGRSETYFWMRRTPCVPNAASPSPRSTPSSAIP